MDNPIYMINEKSEQGNCSSSSSVSGTKEKSRDQAASFDYVKMDLPPTLREKCQSAVQKHMWIFPYCALVAVLISCGAVIGLIALSAELHRSHYVRQTTYQSPCNGSGVPAPNVGSTAGPAATPGTVYTRWGVDSCSESSTLIYAGVTASGSSQNPAIGGGGNYVCMTSEPEYRAGTTAKEDPRSRIYGAEYRNGINFGDMTGLHGHDVPCAACLTTGGRQAFLMIPGKPTCPENWTMEYNGYLMAARHNQLRTSYICVDFAAETRPGTAAEDPTSSLLFPVETVCGTGGGIPCSPYEAGKELTCVVCTM